MFASPRVIAIDDERAHLTALVNALHRNGVACLPIHFTADTTGIKESPDVRIVFADLHLAGPAADRPAQFATLGGLLEGTIKPAGPYFILLWTRYADQAAHLREFLHERLQGVTTPFDVVPLAKSEHLDATGRVQDEGKLIRAIADLTGKLPQLGALFDWESRVLGAAGSTVSSLLELVPLENPEHRPAAVGRLLAHIGIGAVGKGHVDRDRFRAVNEALLPILADRIAKLRIAERDTAIWQAAFDAAGADAQPLDLSEAARLNRMIHLDTGAAVGTDPGAVVPLPDPWSAKFVDHFGIDEPAAASAQFRCKGFVPNDDRFRWVLVQAQAACDHAQSHAGPLPCYLGLDLPHASRRSGTAPSALWTSPAFELDEEVRLLCVSARFPVAPPPDRLRTATPRYRLREHVLTDLIYHLHSHGARPGMISFRGK